VEAMRRGRPYCMGRTLLADQRRLARGLLVEHRLLRQLEGTALPDEGCAGTARAGRGAERRQAAATTPCQNYLQDYNDLRLTVQVVDFHGPGSGRSSREWVMAKANDSRVVKTFNVADLVTEEEKAHTIIRAFLTDRRGNVISTKDHFFYWPNKLDLPETEVKTRIKVQRWRVPGYPIEQISREGPVPGDPRARSPLQRQLHRPGCRARSALS